MPRPRFIQAIGLAAEKIPAGTAGVQFILVETM